jgi:hypothetical protein
MGKRRGTTLLQQVETNQVRKEVYADGFRLRAAYQKRWHTKHDAELAKYALPDVSVWHGLSWDALQPHLENVFKRRTDAHTGC